MAKAGKINRDIYGKALLDYFNGSPTGRLTTTSDITEEDELPLEYLFRPVEQMPEMEKKALEVARGKILDVGAGAGSHSLALQQAGKEVYALDFSPGATDVCQKREIRHCICQDILKHEGKYDTVLLLMNGAGMAGKKRRLVNFLSHLKSLINEGGQILTDSTDIKYMYEEEDGSMWIDLSKDYYGDLKFRMHYGGESTDEFDWLYVDFETLRKAADKAGLHCEKVMEGEHFDYLARLYIANK